VTAVPPDPGLGKVTSAFRAAGARFVVIGGFAVIANGFVRATEDIDLLVPEDAANDRRTLAALVALEGVIYTTGTPVSAADVARAHVRALTTGGLVDLLREGIAPLDFDTVERYALRADLGAGAIAVAGLRSIVAFKRLSGRPRDLLDLAELEALHGELPIDPLPGLDEPAA
jgi:hypothetical protein